MRIREAGYVAKLVSAFVAAAPTEMYHYAAEHATELISNLAKNMMYLGTCDVVRFLLDIPLIGTSTLLLPRRREALVGRELGSDRPLRRVSRGQGDGRLHVPAAGVHHPARHRLRVPSLFPLHRSTSEPERSCVQLVPYLLTAPVAERLLAIAFAATEPSVAYNVFAVLSRVFWTSLPTEQFGLGGEDNALHTEGLDDRDRRVMGTFKEPAATAAVRETLLAHLGDFNALTEREMANETMYLGADAKERRRCPQSMMMLAELFRHFFEYSSPDCFLRATEEVGERRYCDVGARDASPAAAGRVPVQLVPSQPRAADAVRPAGAQRGGDHGRGAGSHGPAGATGGLCADGRGEERVTSRRACRCGDSTST